MRKGQDIKVLPEEKAALKQLQKLIQRYITSESNDLSKILELITNKKVFINQFATEFYKLTKAHIKEKSASQIFYVIDYICKSELKAFREAIKPYIVKLFLRVYKNQKEFGCDLMLLKTIFKSWFHIFPIQTLIDIATKVQAEFGDDLDQLPQEKIHELRKFYKNENVVGYENFLNGSYKKTSAGLTKKVKPNPQQTEDLSGQQIHIKIQPTIKQPAPRIMNVQSQQQPPLQQMPIQNNQMQPQPQQQQQTFYSQQQQIIYNNQQYRNLSYPINTQYNPPYPQANAFQNNFPQLNPQTQLPNQINQYSFLPPPIQQIQPLQNPQPQMQHNQGLNQKQTNQQPIVPQQKLATQIALPFDPQSNTVFGSLFLHFTEQLNNKQDFGNKDNVKEFLKKQVTSSELLSNPNKYSTLMKCPTCFMRFRNQAAYIQHLTNHATVKLEKLSNEGKKENEMSCSVEVYLFFYQQQWMQSNNDNKDKNNQEKNISIALDKLNSSNCVFCLEKFNGKWDSKNCQWVYENVKNYLLESNDLDEPQTISIHQKCSEVLNEFNI